MSVDNVNDIEPRVQYTAAAAQTAFDYPFPIFADADLVVDVDGATQALTTDYTVTGEGEDTGGTVTFVSAMAGGEVVTIYRDIAIERTTDFQQNGRFSSASFNDELDKIIMIQQQLEARINRALRFGMAEAVTSAEAQLPAAANRANKFLYFDAQGAPEMATFDGNGTVLSASVIGALLYPVTDAETDAAVTVVDHSKPPGYVTRYGANTVPGTTDMSAAIQAAVDSNNEVVLPAETLKITSAITLRTGVTISGAGKTSIVSTAADINAFSGTSKTDIILRDFAIAGATSTASTSGVYLSACSRVLVDNLVISGFSYNGVIGTAGTTHLTVQHCYIHSFANIVENSADIAFYNNCTFSKALFNRCESGADFGVSFEIDSTDNLAHGNTISGSGRYGILAGYENVHKTLRNTVTNNRIKDISGSQLISGVATSGSGIYMVGGGEVLISGNTITNTNTATTTETLAPAGIGINGNFGPVTISNNDIYECDWYGIIVVNDDYAQPVLIANNSVRNCTKTQIYVKNHGYVTISGNQVIGTNAAAVDGLFVYGQDADYSNVSITGNWIKGAASGMTNGIRLEGVNEFVVSGNYVTAAQSYGVTMTNCDDGSLGPNTVRGAVTGAIRFSTCNRVHASGGHYDTDGTYSVTGAGTGADNLLDNAYINPALATNASGSGLRILFRSTSAPASGTWAVGDTMYLQSPTAGGSIGSVCTAAGTPGTWNTFGAVTA